MTIFSSPLGTPEDEGLGGGLGSSAYGGGSFVSQIAIVPAQTSQLAFLNAQPPEIFLGSIGAFISGTNDIYEETILSHGPVAYYKMDEATGATVLVDSSGNGNNSVSYSGSVVGGQAPLANLADSTNTSLLFQNDHFNIPRTIGGGDGTFTIEFWIKTTSTGNSGSDWYNGSGIVDGEIGGITHDL